MDRANPKIESKYTPYIISKKLKNILIAGFLYLFIYEFLKPWYDSNQYKGSPNDEPIKY